MNTHPLESDIAIAALPRAERLFLWAIRTWSSHHSDLSVVWWNLDRAFTEEHINEALPSFHRLMASLFAGLKRWPDIRCVVCQRLGAEEARLLEMFASVQHGDQAGAQRALSEWLVHPAARRVREAAIECVAIASKSGLRFSSKAARMARQEPTTSNADSPAAPMTMIGDVPLH